MHYKKKVFGIALKLVSKSNYVKCNYIECKYVDEGCFNNNVLIIDYG